MLEERLQPGEESYNIMVLSGRLRPTEFEPLKHDGNPNDESSSCSSFGSRTGIIDMTPRPLHPNLSRGSPFGPCLVNKNRHHFAEDPFAYRYTKDNGNMGTNNLAPEQTLIISYMQRTRN